MTSSPTASRPSQEVLEDEQREFQEWEGWLRRPAPRRLRFGRRNFGYINFCLVTEQVTFPLYKGDKPAQQCAWHVNDGDVLWLVAYMWITPWRWLGLHAPTDAPPNVVRTSGFPVFATRGIAWLDGGFHDWLVYDEVRGSSQDDFWMTFGPMQVVLEDDSSETEPEESTVTQSNYSSNFCRQRGEGELTEGRGDDEDEGELTAGMGDDADQGELTVTEGSGRGEDEGELTEVDY
jgi:hypothetical protein